MAPALAARYRRWATPGLHRRAFTSGAAGVADALLATPRTVSVIGAPLWLGQPLVGVDKGPDQIRSAGLISKIASLGWAVYDKGDLTFAPPTATAKDHPLARHSQAVGAANRIISDAVYEEATQGRFCLNLGGDHSMAIGSIAGLLRTRPNTNILWVDAHADLNTPEKSISKNIHGMVVAFLMKTVDASKISGFHWLTSVPMLPKNHIVYVGLRDLDKFEKTFLKENAIKAYTMQSIDKYGIGKVMEMALSHFESVNPAAPLHLSVDIDSVDPFLAPSTGTKVRGGLSYREANYICEAAYESGAVVSMDMVEVNPMLDQKDRGTADMALEMIASTLGSRIL